MIERNLWQIVTGVETRPVPNADATAAYPAILASAQSDWDERDQLAQSQIGLAVKPTMLPHIRNKATAKEMWDSLEAFIMSTNAINQSLAQRQLFNIRMREGDDLKKYLARFTKTAAQLTTLVPAFDKGTIVITLLNSLPPSFQIFRMSVLAKDSVPDLEWVKTRLFILDATTVDHPDSENGAALFSRGSKGQRHGKGVQSCWDCLKSGHRRGDHVCPKPGANMARKPKPENGRQKTRGDNEHLAEVVIF